MIDFIYGKIDFIDPQYIVVETHGVGYEIFCPNPFIFQKEKDQLVKVYTYQHVREDINRLYGFPSRKEKALFLKLLNVSGIGPKGALAILASGQPEQLAVAIEEENEKFLMKFPGVGKKTARQIILDLKGKMEEFIPDYQEQESAAVVSTLNDDLYNTALSEAMEALRALGYVERELSKVLPQLKKEKLSTDEYIKKALQLLLKG